MSTITMNFFASTLNFRTEVKVVLPEYALQRNASVPRKSAFDPAVKFPVVYLLHGFTGDYSDWNSMVPIERYACETGFAVVMPHGYNSWYLNVPGGVQMEDFLACELPAAMEAMLPVSDQPEDRFIAGLSMGGMGAVHTALKYPETFGACASASAVLSYRRLMHQYAKGTEDEARMLESLACATRNGTVADMDEIYLQLKASGLPMPPHLCLFGEQDEMYVEQFLWFKRFAEQNNLPVETASWEGQHDFLFWDPAVRRMLQYFQLKRNGVQKQMHTCSS